MLGSTQSDPIWILSIAQQRQAELRADVRHDHVVQAALEYRDGRSVRPENTARRRFGRLAAAVSATLRLAPFAPTAVHGG